MKRNKIKGGGAWAGGAGARGGVGWGREGENKMGTKKISIIKRGPPAMGKAKH